ncbi:PLP-dependent aminotransferase family protein [Actinomycetospora termitidis]|uniref:PLP-dependent aminotransferase family protein n=1 Tax=Actinomycetospora termitidis TaxID=3053470 RepID=A0ABT7MDG3_9PSEU|nr:PLP-dependent aminotransferase family protein [Actinomycetospora sp. Odt1-22]MDL5158022.1 PLP-dependent aminotransferase family protein [Actinomycetospora sp. Odt1-22]
MDQQVGGPALVRHLGSFAGGPVGYAALAGRIRTLLGDGRLAVGTRVPSERELALALGIGRGTVAAAYEQLRESGHLIRRRGSGTWTALPSTADGPPSSPAPFAPSGAWAVSPDLPADVIDLAHAAPAAPVEAMTAAGAEALAALPTHLVGPGYDLLGTTLLRVAIADRLTAQGLPTAPDEVMVTAGAQHAHSLIARALVRPGDRVLIEQPTYPGAVDLVRHASARTVPMALDRDGHGRTGWDVGAFAAALRESAPALAFLVPDHHNPTGAVMDAETRGAVVAAARRHGVPLVVDDCLRETWLDEPVPPPLGAWATAGGEAPVLTLGSMSKTVWGGLRIGWMRGPRAVLRRIATSRASDDIASPVLEQLVAAGLLARLDDLLPVRRAATASQRDHLVAALRRAFPEWTVPVPTGGLSTWIDLGAARSSALVDAAARQGLHLAAGPRFGIGGAFESFLRVPYTHRVDVLDDAVERLAAAWASLGTLSSPALTTVV